MCGSFVVWWGSVECDVSINENQCRVFAVSASKPRPLLRLRVSEGRGCLHTMPSESRQGGAYFLPKGGVGEGM